MQTLLSFCLKLQPAEMLQRLNSFMCEQKVEDRFMTLCFITWQRGRMRLRIANAGQSQPLVLRAGKVQRVPITGFPLGIFDQVQYDEWVEVLGADDIVVLYSDGLTEAHNAEGDLFGFERLSEVLLRHAPQTAATIADRLMDAVAGFSAGPPSDDRTLVVFKVR